MNSSNLKGNWLSGDKLSLVFLLITSIGFGARAQSVADFTIAEKACVSEDIQFVNTSTVASGDTLTYNWIIQDSTVGFSSQKDPNYSWANNGSYSIKLITENQYGDTSQVEKTVSIKQIPSSDFIWDRACEGVATSFDAIGYNADSFGSVDYHWTFEDTIEIERHVSYKYDSVGSYSVVLEVVTDHGCRDTSTQTVEVKEFIEADYEFESVCVGDEICFRNLTKDSTKSYFWNFGDGEVSYEFSPCHTFREPGIYNVILKVIHEGCNDQIVKQVTINPLPDASFTYEKFGRTVEFDGPAGSDKYRWTFGNGDKETLEDPTYVYRNSLGTFTVCLYVQKGMCFSSECQDISFYVSINSISESKLNIHPNPSNGVFSIEVIGQADIIATNIEGKIISTSVTDISGGYSVDLGEVPSGTYYLKVISENIVTTRQIFITK